MQRRGYLKYFLLTILATSLAACSDNEYLLHSVKGHFELLSLARPIDQILQNRSEPEDVQEQLSTIVKLREFAVEELLLPDSGSYKKYADLKRPYAVWNVVAAPELSLDLYEWCYPILGCVTYRGYFDELSAHAVAKYLEEQGFDVDVYGVQAYSTLNWFDDPVLNTFLVKDEVRLASLLFHEMAHQVLYVKDDSLFNESFAKTVEMEGLRRWFSQQASPGMWEECQRRERITTDFQHYLSTVSERLEKIYVSTETNDVKRDKKADALAQAYADYELLKQHWGGYDGYDDWMGEGLNNARLSSIATYYGYVPAFNELLRQVDYDLADFYREVKTIASLSKEKRISQMEALSLFVKASLK